MSLCARLGVVVGVEKEEEELNKARVPIVGSVSEKKTPRKRSVGDLPNFGV